MGNSNDLDAKLARIAGRVEDRAAGIRAELDRIGALEMATLCREAFGAKLAYLQTDRMGMGTDVQSVPYNFNLGPKHDAATRPVRKRTPVPGGRRDV